MTARISLTVHRTLPTSLRVKAGPLHGRTPAPLTEPDRCYVSKRSTGEPNPALAGRVTKSIQITENDRRR